MAAIDVIIPCYNYGRYLGDCVESIVSQPNVDVRVLIIDDASSDDTRLVGPALAARYESVEYRKHSRNHGHIATYNEGFQWATSEYSLLISADDALAPGALGRAIREMERHSQIGLCYGREIEFCSHEVPSASAAGSNDCRVESGQEFIERLCSTASNPVTTPSAVVRTSLVKQLGGYQHRLPHTADLELWLRIGVYSKVAILGAVQAFKRVHGTNMHVDYAADGGLGDLQQRRLAFESLFQQYSDVIAESSVLNTMWKRQLAVQAFWNATRAFESGERCACGPLLHCAEELDPEIPRQQCWRRLRWKQCFGYRLCRVIFRVKQQFKRRHSCKAQSEHDTPSELGVMP